MTEENNNNGNGNTKQAKKSKTEVIQDDLMEKIDKAMVCTAEKLDETANKLHDTAGFFRQTNTCKLKSETEEIVKKYPKHVLAGAAVIGFLLGAIISR